MSDTRRDSFPFGQQTVWRPSAETVSDSNLTRFMQRHNLASFEELMERSTDDVEWFWSAVLKELNIEFYRPCEYILDLSEGIPFARWCPGGRMNIVHNCLDKWQSLPVRSRAAIRYENEDGQESVLTYQDLHREVNRCANALRGIGLGRKDVVGLFMPMTPELVISFLAVIKIGGIVLPLFSGYGAAAVSSRLIDAQAAALVTADGFLRRGRAVHLQQTVDNAVADSPSVSHVITVDYLGSPASPSAGPAHRYSWRGLMENAAALAETAQTDAEDILMVMYTSGTTGSPKGAIHTHCGFPIKAAQDMHQCMDFKPGNTMFWMTDMGWMMGPWEIFGTFLLGGTLVLYSGAPDFPDAGRTWSLVEARHITHLGLSPTFVRTVKPHGTQPFRDKDLSSLRAVCSTGSPWDPESWMWLFEHVLESRKPILNYSGGTEISGGIVCGNLLKPLKPAAFSGPVPGMAADVVDDSGNSVRGAVGELVIRKPWIGMTRGFWNDRQRYLETYWNRFDNVWVHGDFAAIDDDGLWYIVGRSDDTIKIAGKRLGPAEIESVLNAHPAVSESAAIGVPHDVKGQEVVAFCVLEPGSSNVEMVRMELIERIVKDLGKPLTPREIRFTKALPKTRNAKVMHRLIRSAYLGQETGDAAGLEDPAALEAIQEAV